MNIFKVNDSMCTYTYPVIKIIIALTVIVMCIFRSHLIHTKSGPISTVITIICFVLTIASIFVIYLSVSEIGYAYENREAKKMKIQSINSFTSKDFTIDEIVEMVEKNDIMDIVIKSEKSVVKIGVSSDCKHSNYIFFDKVYYVDDNEYDTINKFKTALTPLSKKEKFISVISIDGIRPG